MNEFDRIWAPPPARSPDGGRVSEPAARSSGDPPTERHLQCVWFDPALRPPRLATLEGEPVTVEEPGIWNLQAGPDFLGAAIRIGGANRRVCGDVEVHLRPSGWRSHEHAGDPRYGNVRIHVTYEAASPVELPPGAIEIPMKPALEQCPGFSFQAIDLAAYPYGVRASPAPCARVLAAWPPDRRVRLFEAAGAERLRRKAASLGSRIASCGADQVLYEEMMSALGYARNKGAFLRLARAVPWSSLVREAAGDPSRAWALLLGVSGLAAYHAMPRAAWDIWWKLRGRWDEYTLPRGIWRMDGLRPLNRPERRFQTAAAWAAGGAGPADVLQKLLQNPPEAFSANSLAWLTWPGRGGAIGKGRARVIVINVFLPAAGALAGDEYMLAAARHSPDEPSNSIERLMAHTLLGPDHPPSFRRGCLRRQGLIQIFREFCLADRSRCAGCPFPTLLQRAAADADHLASSIPEAGNTG